MKKLFISALLLVSTSAFSQSYWKAEYSMTKIHQLDCLEFNNEMEPFAGITYEGAGLVHMSVMSSLKLCRQLKRAMKKEGFQPVLARFSNNAGVYEIEYQIDEETFVLTDKREAKRAENAELIN